ncbi:hypothetical protein AX14_000067 [Amanita brunnescens Koide BX004]|nr:hypothetical protein AX14_000067 [Amanita brunnescens Koide BX004]
MDPREWIGKRVFFWDATDTAIYGTVVGDRTIPGDGTYLLIVEKKSGECVSLPAAGVTLVPP